jgi:hypothetical protein
MRREGGGDSGEINLGRLADLALRRMVMGVGDVRLVGWTSEDLPGIQFSPVAAQNASRTLVVCHLRRGPLPDIERDLNVRLDHFAPTTDSADGDSPTDSSPQADSPENSSPEKSSTEKSSPENSSTEKSSPDTGKADR